MPEVALGLLAVYESTHRAADGTEVVVAVSLKPTTDGRWMVSEIGGTRSRWPPTPVLRDVLLRFQSLGVIIPGPGTDGHYRADLARLLGVYRYKALDDALHPHGGDGEDDALAALEEGVAA
ncbi:hypothetical protein CIW48_24695 [Methylobacterium sp. P1-11]|nr:hypothetical protein CIW48_24695 [Methylobacterium sp. P1-11]